MAVDLRRGSPTFGQWVGERLSAENKRQMIPARLRARLRGAQRIRRVPLQDHRLLGAGTRRCIVWNDPELKIDWPLQDAPCFRRRTARARHSPTPTASPERQGATGLGARRDNLGHPSGMPRISPAAGSFVLKAYFHAAALAGHPRPCFSRPLLWQIFRRGATTASSWPSRTARRSRPLLPCIPRCAATKNCRRSSAACRCCARPCTPGDPLLQKIANEALAIRRRTGADVIYHCNRTAPPRSPQAQADSFVHRNFAFRPYYREAMQGPPGASAWAPPRSRATTSPVR